MQDIPTLPYEIAATDLFEWRNDMYLVTVDSYSGFYDIDKLPDTSSKTVITKLKKQFSIHGIPRILFSDNGTQFTSREFKNFAQMWNFQQVTSSPKYPQSNGLAERAVRSAKSLMNKCAEDNTDPYLALLFIRNTQRPGLESSAERLFSRHTKTTLPTKEISLKPKLVEKVSENLKRIRMQKKQYYDKRARPLQKLEPKDIVRMETDKGFEKIGKIVKEADRPRGYVVEINGKQYERNRKHLLKVEEQLKPEAEFEIDKPPEALVKNPSPTRL